MSIIQLADRRPGNPPAPVPANLSRRADRRDSGESRTVYGLHAIARMFAYQFRSEAWLVEFIGALIAQEDFPAPLPVMINGALTRGISPRRSRWLARAVDAWFRAQLGADADRIEADEADARAREAAGRLDDNAEHLFEKRP